MHVYLLPALQSGPVVIERLVRAISPAHYDLALIADRFTPREVIAHLADWEPIMLARMQQARAQPGSTVMGQDEGEMAIRNGYRASNIDEQLMHFAAKRMETIAFVQSLTPDELPRTVVHNERGAMTLDDQANLLVGHDLYHIEQLSAYLTA